jgi:hypothetical protein
MPLLFFPESYLYPFIVSIFFRELINRPVINHAVFIGTDPGGSFARTSTGITLKRKDCIQEKHAGRRVWKASQEGTGPSWGFCTLAAFKNSFAFRISQPSFIVTTIIHCILIVFLPFGYFVLEVPFRPLKIFWFGPLLRDTDGFTLFN